MRRKRVIEREQVLAKLQALGCESFSILDIANCAGLGEENMSFAHSIGHDLVRAGHLMRVGQGLYAPASAIPMLDQKIAWYVRRPYQLSHQSAMAAYASESLIGYPQIIVSAGAPQRTRLLAPNLEMWVVSRSEQQQGKPIWMDLAGLGNLPVSDPETTLLDGLRLPELCGGLLAVCRFVAARRGRWDARNLCERAGAIGVRSLGQRAGALLEWAEDPAAQNLDALVPEPNGPLAKLDANGSRTGKVERRWRLRINVALEEVQHALRGTPGQSGAV
jgi:predicted transcriptional regulator of viral defense system